MRALAVIATLACAPATAFAYRPFDQTDADTAELDTIELEIGPLRFTRGNGSSLYEPGGVFNYGFSPGWEFVVDLDGSLPIAGPMRPTRSLLYTDVLVKHVVRDGVLQDQPGPSIAIELGPLMPTLPSLLDEAGWSTAMMISEKWRPLTVHANLQVEYTRERQLSFTGGAIFEGPSTWTIRPVGEAYVERTAGDTLDSLLAGAIWRYRDSLTFDAAVRVVRDRGANTGELRVGLTWVLPT